MDLKGKVALVTGGGNGIGYCTCVSFALAGAKVMVVDIDEEHGLSTVEKIRETGGEAEFCRADVSLARYPGARFSEGG